MSMIVLLLPSAVATAWPDVSHLTDTCQHLESKTILRNDWCAVRKSAEDCVAGEVFRVGKERMTLRGRAVAFDM